MSGSFGVVLESFEILGDDFFDSKIAGVKSKAG